MTWPTPGATPLDRARTIARTYRAALARANPQQAALFDDAARRVGEGWITDPTTAPQACTVAEAALLLGVTDRRIRQLITKNEIPSAGKTSDGHVLLVRDVLAYQKRTLAQRDVSALPSTAGG